MLVRELKEELETRDQPKTGNKACWLRRRLHGAIQARSCAASCRAIDRLQGHFYRFVTWVKLLTILIEI